MHAFSGTHGRPRIRYEAFKPARSNIGREKALKLHLRKLAYDLRNAATMWRFVDVNYVVFSVVEFVCYDSWERINKFLIYFYNFFHYFNNKFFYLIIIIVRLITIHRIKTI